MVTSPPSSSPDAFSVAEKNRTTRFGIASATKALLGLVAAGAVGGGSYVVGQQHQTPAFHAQDSVGNLTRQDLEQMISSGVSKEMGPFRTEFEAVRTQAKYAEALAQSAKNSLDTSVKEMSGDVTDIKVMLAAIKSRMETEDRLNSRQK